MRLLAVQSVVSAVTVICAQDTRPKPGGPPRKVVVGVLAKRLREKALSFHIEVLCLSAT